MQLKKLCKNSRPPPPIHCTSLTLTFFIGREVFGIRHGSSSLKHLRTIIKKEQGVKQVKQHSELTTRSLQGRNSEERRLVSV